jgi:hypothetical protein
MRAEARQEGVALSALSADELVTRFRSTPQA